MEGAGARAAAQSGDSGAGLPSLTAALHGEPAQGTGTGSTAGGAIPALHGHWEKPHAVSEPPSFSKISVGEIFPPREHA